MGFEGKAGRAGLQQTQHRQVKDPLQTFHLNEDFIQVQKYENKTKFSSSFSINFLCISLYLSTKPFFFSFRAVYYKVNLSHRSQAMVQG